MLKVHEEEMENHLLYIEENLRTTTTDPINRVFAYVTRDDLIKIYNEETVLTIRNHREIFKPGLMQGDDNVVLDRALIVVSEDALDVRLVSQISDLTKSDPQQSAKSEVYLLETPTNKRKMLNASETSVSKRKRSTSETVSDDELSDELSASAQVVLGKETSQPGELSKFFYPLYRAHHRECI